jgi:hypothetical protein
MRGGVPFSNGGRSAARQEEGAPSARTSKEKAMRLRFRPLAAATLLVQTAVLAPSPSLADVPQGITEQGRLFDAGGNPIDAAVTLTFSLYPTAAGGTAVWTEQQTVMLDEGYFSVQLGAVTPIPPATWNGSVYYVGIKVGADPEMSPRQPTFAVPYALVTSDAVGDIHPTTVSVNGQLVIDANGTWVGPPTNLVGPTGAQGPAGAAGPAGAQGPAGPAGSAGPIGPQGPVGPAGASGAQGAQGPQGPQGSPGLQGPAGANGADGAQGPPGPAGADGAAGANGATGATGADGATGAGGATGATGATGAAGAQGPQGPQGPAGAQGPTGAAGAQGTAGSNGSNGAQGATGAAGSNGSNGAQGSAGTAGATGAQGAIGPTGATGPQGVAGAQGATGTIGATGAQGAIGPTGATGPQGATGTTGAQGAAGSANVAFYSATNTGYVGPAGSWTTVPGLTMDVTLTQAGTMQVTVGGNQRLAGSNSSCQVGYRVQVDGVGRGDATWGTKLQDSISATDYHVIWTLVDSFPLAAGTHTISIGVDQPGFTTGVGCNICAEFDGTLAVYDGCTFNALVSQ